MPNVHGLESEDVAVHSAVQSTGPSRVRFLVLSAGCSLALVTYIHRVGFATASPEIKRSLALDDRDVSSLMAAFMIAYGLFEMPWGALGDRFGVRRILTLICLGGSLFTALIPTVGLLPVSTSNVGSVGVAAVLLLLSFRFLFGAFQAGTFPAISRMLADWMPVNERGGAQGILWTSSRVGGAVAPVLLTWLVFVTGDWKPPLLIAGCLGLLWCACFWPWYRDRLEDMAGVNDEERELIRVGRVQGGNPRHGPVPWATMLGSRSAWALCLSYGFLGYSGNFYMTMLPVYLRDHRHLESGTMSLLMSLPFVCGIFACLGGGMLSDLLIRHQGKRWGRRVVGAAGLALGSVGILAVSQASSVWALSTLLCLTLIGNDLAMAPSWAAAADIGGRHTGALSGAMNMLASFSGAIGASFAGHMFHDGHLLIPFLVFSASYALGALCWLAVDVTHTIDEG